MELEKLNKSQIVLLTLLVSFVTSIATGIVTVSLMEQAPPAITQTVNRIVERTVEKVAPDAIVAAAGAATPEVIVARDSERIVETVARVSPSVVRLYAPAKDESGRDTRAFVGMGIVIDASGILIADPATPDFGVTALRADGVEVSVSVIGRPEGATLIRLQAPATQDNKPLDWKPLTLSSRLPQLGETIITIAGRTSARVAQGIVTAVPEKGEGPRFVETDVPGEAFATGSPLLTTDGALIGVATAGSRAAASGGFLASSGVLLQNTGDEQTAQ